MFSASSPLDSFAMHLRLASNRVGRRVAFAAATLAALGCLLPAAPLRAQLAPQVTPAVSGTSLADPAIPTVISTPVTGSQFYVLNQDLSLLSHSSVYSNYNRSCAAPSGFNAGAATPRTLLNDTQTVFITAQSSTGANVAATQDDPTYIPCVLTPAVNVPGVAAPTTSLSAVDPRHSRMFVVSGFAGSGPDTITVESISPSGSGLSQQARTALDVNGQYTSIVTDTGSNYGLTAVTELKTATSPGNLYVYSPGINTAFKILGPGGVPLPAIGSFLLPNPTDSGGSLLVLVNQDNLTAANAGSPPVDSTPFTIIDLGQLQATFSSVVANGNTITLPFVTSIAATTPYFAMLGAAYNPVNHLVYALVARGSAASPTQSVISYDPTVPNAPAETVVADASAVPFAVGTYPQLALNAAAGTLQILTPNPNMLYSVGIAGTGNTAVAVNGTPFADSGFNPTYIAANTLLGETYIASRSGQVDIITLPSSGHLQATLTLQGDDTAITGQSYYLRGLVLYPTGDSALIGAPVTITATPGSGGAAFTFGTTTVGSFAYPGGSFSSGSFPAAGTYTLVASVPATANYPALTSNPIHVTVAATSLAGVFADTLSLSVPASSTSTSVNASVTFAGSTYGPTGRVTVTDGAGNEVGRVYLVGAPITVPLLVPLTLPQGTSVLTAAYNGDAQNAPSTSAAASIVVGAGKATATLSQTIPSTASAGATVAATVTLRSTSTTVPTGNITVSALASGSTTPITLATVAVSAFNTPIPVSFTAPAANTYTVLISYTGDANFNSATTGGTLVTTAPSGIATTLTVTSPSTLYSGAAFNATVKITTTTTSTATPTGTIVLTATPAGGSATTVATIPFLQAYTTAGQTVPVTLSPGGSYTLTATYAGDANYSASTASTTIAVSTPASQLTLAAPATASVGVPFNAVVTFTNASPLPPTGNIVITATVAGGATTTVATITPASTTVPVSLPAAGTYTLAATYAGDAAHASATSATTTITATTPPTQLTLAAPATAFVGVPFNAAVTFTNASPVAATGSVLVTATATGGATTTVATVSAASAAAGVTVPVSLPAAGTYTLTASYAGDAAHTSATSSSSTITVGKTVPTLTLSLPSPAVVDQPININVAFRSGSSTAPTGSVTITYVYSGSQVSAGSVSAAAAAAPGGTLFVEHSLAAATLVFTASYAGDANFAPASTTFSITIGYPPSTLTGPASATTSLPITYHVLIPGFLTSGTLNVVGTLAGVRSVLATDVAYHYTLSPGGDIAVTFPLAGNWVLTAEYVADPLYPAAVPSSAGLPVTVTQLSTGAFTFTLDDKTLDDSHHVTVDRSTPVAKEGLTITALQGFNTPVLLSYTTDLTIPGLAYSFVDASGNTITSVTPVAAGTHVNFVITRTYSAALFRSLGTPLYCGGGLMLLGLLALRRRPSALRRALYLCGAATFVVSVGSVLAGCGNINYTAIKVNLTATPSAAGSTAPAQSVSFQLDEER